MNSGKKDNPKDTISVVIPVMNDWDNLQKVINCLASQTYNPSEIIVVDSSSNNEIEESISEKFSSIPIKYIRAGRAYTADRLIQKYFSFAVKNKKIPGRAYPYEATNMGAEIACSKWVAFLDTATLPSKSWLKSLIDELNNKNLDLVLGSTRYFAHTRFQKLLQACTYGKFGHETMPGSIIKAEIYNNNFKIREGVRAGGDIEWRQRVKSKFKWSISEDNFLSYSNLPKNFFSCAKKMFIYQLHSARVDIQHTVKDIYLGLFLLFSVIIVPKWNSFVGWESSPFFIPNITKIYLISILTLFFFSFLISRGVFRGVKISSFVSNILRFSLLVLIFIIAYRWNAVIANWVEDSVWFFPHITKIFVGSVILTALFYRGIYFPLTHGILKNYLFPVNWILVGSLGILLDIVKAPGYLIGSVSSIFVKKLDSKL